MMDFYSISILFRQVDVPFISEFSSGSLFLSDLYFQKLTLVTGYTLYLVEISEIVAK